MPHEIPQTQTPRIELYNRALPFKVVPYIVFTGHIYPRQCIHLLYILPPNSPYHGMANNNNNNSSKINAPPAQPYHGKHHVECSTRPTQRRPDNAKSNAGQQNIAPKKRAIKAKKKTQNKRTRTRTKINSFHPFFFFAFAFALAAFGLSCGVLRGTTRAPSLMLLRLQVSFDSPKRRQSPRFTAPHRP